MSFVDNPKMETISLVDHLFKNKTFKSHHDPPRSCIDDDNCDDNFGVRLSKKISRLVKMDYLESFVGKIFRRGSAGWVAGYESKYFYFSVF